MELKKKLIKLIGHSPICGDVCWCDVENKAEAIMELCNREWCNDCLKKAVASEGLGVDKLTEIAMTKATDASQYDFIKSIVQILHEVQTKYKKGEM